MQTSYILQASTDAEECKGGGTVSPTLTAENTGVCKVEKVSNEERKLPDWDSTEYRIRKLTAKECYRLMDVPEEKADIMLSTNSQTQCYKQAGNSIVVSVLCAVFSQLGIQDIKPWNERTLKERYDLVANPKAHIE